MYINISKLFVVCYEIANNCEKPQKGSINTAAAQYNHNEINFSVKLNF